MEGKWEAGVFTGKGSLLLSPGANSLSGQTTANLFTSSGGWPINLCPVLPVLPVVPASCINISNAHTRGKSHAGTEGEDSVYGRSDSNGSMNVSTPKFPPPISLATDPTESN